MPLTVVVSPIAPALLLITLLPVPIEMDCKPAAWAPLPMAIEFLARSAAVV